MTLRPFLVAFLEPPQGDGANSYTRLISMAQVW
jgi:hypothetical protein